MIGKPPPRFKCKALTPDQKFKDIQLEDYQARLFVQPRSLHSATAARSLKATRPASWDALVTLIFRTKLGVLVTHIRTNIPRDKGGVSNLTFPLLSDMTRDIAKDYMVMNEDEGYPIRGLFIIDKKGILRHMSFNDVSVGRSVDEAMRLLLAIKFIDEHGHGKSSLIFVCPINWKPGDQAIDVTKAYEYF